MSEKVTKCCHRRINCSGHHTLFRYMPHHTKGTRSPNKLDDGSCTITAIAQKLYEMMMETLKAHIGLNFLRCKQVTDCECFESEWIV